MVEKSNNGMIYHFDGLYIMHNDTKCENKVASEIEVSVLFFTLSLQESVRKIIAIIDNKSHKREVKVRMRKL
jgi:hypothetical protein